MIFTINIDLNYLIVLLFPDTRDLQQILLRIQHEQVKILAELPGLANNTGHFVNSIKNIIQ